MTAVIFGNSILPARKSYVASGAVTHQITGFMSKFKIITSLSEYGVRKAAHFFEFFILGFFLTNALRFFRLRKRHFIGLLLLLFLLVSASDEIIQLFMPGRTSRISDVLLDTFGAVMGMLACISFSALIKKKHKIETGKS
jgi:VanZ family protein